MKQILARDEEEIFRLISAGKTIEAIKRIRELTGVSLIEAGNYIHGLERSHGTPTDMPDPKTRSPLPTRSPIVLPLLRQLEMRGLVLTGKTVEALFRLREELPGASLLEAKRYLDGLREPDGVRKDLTTEELSQLREELDDLLRLRQYFGRAEWGARGYDCKRLRQTLIAVGQGSSSIQPFIEVLRDHRYERLSRAEVAFALGEIGNQQAVGPLESELQIDWFHTVPCGEIARALDKLGWVPSSDAARTRHLIARACYLMDTCELAPVYNYRDCLKELEGLDSADAVEVMIQTVEGYFAHGEDFPHGGNPYMIDDIMMILADHADERVIGSLINMLNTNIMDSDGGIVHGHGYAAAKALVKIGEAAIPQLVKALEDENRDTETHTMADYALRLIDDQLGMTNKSSKNHES